MVQYFSQKELLKVPKTRAAFSDRMAYVMMEMSRIAYDKFEEEASKNKFSTTLKENGFTLVDIFNNDGTQGFLCKHEEHKIAVLAFRGTEVTEWAASFSQLAEECGLDADIVTAFKELSSYYSKLKW